jgi:hypothetical protein
LSEVLKLRRQKGKGGREIYLRIFFAAQVFSWWVHIMLIDIGFAHYKLFLRRGITRFSIQGVLDGEKVATSKGSLAFKVELAI